MIVQRPLTLNNTTIKRSAQYIPMAVVALLFFVFGFLTWINAILIPYFKIACQLSNFQSYLVAFAFYISYFILSVPFSYLLKRTGFKNGIVIGLCIVAAGVLLFVPAAYYRSYVIFLTGLFGIGTGLALLQPAANAYVTTLGPMEKAARRISIVGICNKAAGIVAPILFASIILRVSDTTLFNALPSMTKLELNTALDELIARVILPYSVLAIIILALAGLVRYVRLPEVNEEDSIHASTHQKTIFEFPHLILGALAIFFHVGTQVIAIDTIIGYASSMNISLMEAKVFPSYTLFATIVGYCLGIIFIPRFLNQLTVFRICAVMGLVITLLIVFASGTITLLGHTADISLWLVISLGLINAMVWAGIWPLALNGLGKFTKIGASVMIMGLCGSAILPLLYGYLVDVFDARHAYWVLFPCYLFITFYACIGFKIRRWSFVTEQTIKSTDTN
jgi:FHS family L-fucose permease-like MFS transporter